MRTDRRVLGAGGAGVGLLAAVALVLTMRGGESCGEAIRLGPVLLAAGPVSSAEQQGQATHYGPATAGGACGFPSAPAGGYGTALGPAEFAGAAACGGYIEVTGPKGSVTVKVTNLCPECGPGHLDLNDEAFAAIGDLPAGLIPITYRAVEDADVRGPMSVYVKEGSSQWWLGLLVDNQRNPLASVEVSATGGQWLALRRVDYGFWLAENGTGPGPLDVRVTDVLGHQTLLPGVEIAPGTVQVPSGAVEHQAASPEAGTAATAASTPPTTDPTVSTEPSVTPSPDATEAPTAASSSAQPVPSGSRIPERVTAQAVVQRASATDCTPSQAFGARLSAALRRPA